MSDGHNHYWVETAPPVTDNSEHNCPQCSKPITATRQTRRFYKIQNPAAVSTTGIPIRTEVNTTYHNCACQQGKPINKSVIEPQIELHVFTNIRCWLCGERLYMTDRTESDNFGRLLPCNCTKATRIIESDLLPLS